MSANPSAGKGRMAKGRSVEQKRDLVRVFTEEAVRILDVKPEWVTVIITPPSLSIMGEGWGRETFTE